ncbi:MAG: type III-B CRISPR module RAMP protein Cmr6, partial [Syntrophaceae bacterium]|nr:type III-B CRISPR module RAMP protein Cmr6 [Syntrophaceae bacterium]
MQACRNALDKDKLDLSKSQHAGLLLSRYLNVAVKDKEHPGSRTNLYAAARKAAANPQSQCLYQLTFDRWKTSLPKETQQLLHVQGRLIVGLGADNVLETGLTLHHTYGVPYIPGSALKGLAAHYADQVWGKTPNGDKWKKEADYHQTLFGTQEDAGHILFHDAWITPDSLKDDNRFGLVSDVMTPHHGDYYSEKKFEQGPRKGDLIPPTDFDDPNPITFLSVTGSFLVAVSCDVPGDEGDKWASVAMKLLTEALDNWGVGGKTSSGYGRMTPKAYQDVQGCPSETNSPMGHVLGDRVTITRAGDSAKGKPRYQADDGLVGYFINETPPAGETIEAWV